MVIDMTERRLNWRLSMIQHVENVAGKVQYMFKNFKHSIKCSNQGWNLLSLWEKQTWKTLVRLLLKKKSDLGLHCLNRLSMIQNVENVMGKVHYMFQNFKHFSLSVLKLNMVIKAGAHKMRQSSKQRKPLSDCCTVWLGCFGRQLMFITVEHLLYIDCNQ